MLLAGKVALITGAASPLGIGRACARLFAAHGARLALLDREAGALEEAVAELGEPHRALPCDVRDAARCREAADEAAATLGGLDIVVSNAGLVRATPILDIDAAEYELVLDVNLRGTFHVAQACIPHLRAAGGGAIVCVSSIAGQAGGGVFGRAHYAAAKAGILGLAKALARELAGDRIRANAVAPGPIDNDFTRGAMTREAKERIAAQIPMGRLGTPEEVARVCLFLASELSSYVTGAVIDVNGGLLIH